MMMVQRRFYLPQELYTQLQLRAKATRKTITQVLRETLVAGLARTQKARGGGAMRALLELAERAEKENWSGPTDLAERHDEYLGEILEADMQRIYDNRH